MKRLSAILLFSVYLFSATAMNELLKLNVLIEHYGETRSTNSRIDFIHFLVMHYITDDGDSKDDERDSQLPFKSHSSGTASYLSGFIANRIELKVPRVLIQKKYFYNYTDPQISSDFSDLVWKPPAIA